jgi:hypothetical protein
MHDIPRQNAALRNGWIVLLISLPPNICLVFKRRTFQGLYGVFALPKKTTLHVNSRLVEIFNHKSLLLYLIHIGNIRLIA